MADIIIVSIIVIIAFFILRSQLRRLRGGHCCGGCAGCSGNCYGCVSGAAEKAKK